MEGCATKRPTHKPGHSYTQAQTVVCGPTREGARERGMLDHIPYGTIPSCREEEPFTIHGHSEGSLEASRYGVRREGVSRKTIRDPANFLCNECANYAQVTPRKRGRERGLLSKGTKEEKRNGRIPRARRAFTRWHLFLFLFHHRPEIMRFLPGDGGKALSSL